jgi:hypothetical protein
VHSPIDFVAAQFMVSVNSDTIEKMSVLLVSKWFISSSTIDENKSQLGFFKFHIFSELLSLLFFLLFLLYMVICMGM